QNTAQSFAIASQGKQPHAIQAQQEMRRRQEKGIREIKKIDDTGEQHERRQRGLKTRDDMRHAGKRFNEQPNEKKRHERPKEKWFAFVGQGERQRAQRRQASNRTDEPAKHGVAKPDREGRPVDTHRSPSLNADHTSIARSEIPSLISPSPALV